MALKRICLWSGLFLAGVLVGLGSAWLLKVWQPRHGVKGSSPGALTITFSATIDGSDRLIFTPDMAYNEHGRWSPPHNVLFNREAWEDLSQPPPGWSELVKNLDLPKATILTRKGRDVIALEPTPDGFDVYFADTPMGAAPYEVSISIPRK